MNRRGFLRKALGALVGSAAGGAGAMAAAQKQQAAANQAQKMIYLTNPGCKQCQPAPGKWINVDDDTRCVDCGRWMGVSPVRVV